MHEVLVTRCDDRHVSHAVRVRCVAQRHRAQGVLTHVQTAV